MHSCNSLLRRLMPVAGLTIALSALTAFAPNKTMAQTTPGPSMKKAGKYAVELRLPPRACLPNKRPTSSFISRTRARTTRCRDRLRSSRQGSCTGHDAAMAAMPAQSPKTHAEGVPGDYGVVLYFPHGGEYRLDLTITPPGGGLYRLL